MLCETRGDLMGVTAGERCVLVPTMGALHPGHLRLIETARATGGPVVVSVFVNAEQFNDADDFNRYPRDLEADVAAARAAGADAVFAPATQEVYPDGADAVDARLPGVASGKGLEDDGRPGHFLGVVRVLRRLFSLTACRAAVFGEKDWQQLLIARAIAKGVEIVPHPIERDPDGLAMSSRNRHLSAQEREEALAIPAAVAAASDQGTVSEAESVMGSIIHDAGGRVDYATVRHAVTLDVLPGDTQRQDTDRPPARILVAADFGGVRLLDNAPWPAA
ncbi:MAG: pantoate--beta-alanine ligase [Planctomycetota bacterium]